MQIKLDHVDNRLGHVLRAASGAFNLVVIMLELEATHSCPRSSTAFADTSLMPIPAKAGLSLIFLSNH
jgi:hypothetical protein